MAAKSVPPAPDKIEQAKLLYDSGVAPISEILKLTGMSVGRFRRFREQNNWPKRPSACTPNKKAADEGPSTPKKPRDAGRLIARLEEAVEQEFARAEKALARHAPKSVEASARTLASLVKTLAELKRMRRETEDKRDGPTDDSDAGGGDSARDEPPRELAELRAELGRRLERLREPGPAE